MYTNPESRSITNAVLWKILWSWKCVNEDSATTSDGRHFRRIVSHVRKKIKPKKSCFEKFHLKFSRKICSGKIVLNFVYSSLDPWNKKYLNLIHKRTVIDLFRKRQNVDNLRLQFIWISLNFTYNFDIDIWT